MIHELGTRSVLNQTRPLPGERLCIAAFLAIALTSSFYLLDWHHARSFAQGKTFLDLGFPWESSVPLRAGWVWVYLLYFPVCFTPLLFRELRQDLSIFRKTAFGFAAQFLLALLSFMLFPARMVRPEFVPTNLSESVLHWFYGIDPGFNIFPSLHVANTAFLACLTRRLGGRPAGAAAWLFCALTALSALFVKQHYLLDLPAGFVLGVSAYHLAFAESLGFLAANWRLGLCEERATATPAVVEITGNGNLRRLLCREPKLSAHEESSV